MFSTDIREKRKYTVYCSGVGTMSQGWGLSMRFGFPGLVLIVFWAVRFSMGSSIA